jgi:hypothetical protein
MHLETCTTRRWRTAQSSDKKPTSAAVADGTENAAAEGDRIWGALRRRTEEMVASGMREGHARGLAYLEKRIAQCPYGWGDDLVVLLYGDFDAPPAELDFPDLGITIEPEKVTTRFIKSALCVLNARVKIPEKSVKALVDAAARINTLLGVLAVLTARFVPTSPH